MIAAGVALVALAAFVGRYTSGRSRTSADQLRAQWGQPLAGWRDMPSIADYHRWRAAEEGPAGFVDDRTWDDLDLDLVFSLVDRTRSTVGRQALYHRLRSTLDEEGLARFESLIRHFSEREPERVQVQLLLSRVSQAAGYRLWRICRGDTVEVRSWYAVFPILAGGAVGAIVAYLVWPRALLVLFGIAIVNIALRVMLHGRIHHLLGPFRQIGPLLSCAEYVLDPSVSGAFGDDVRAHLPRLRSLKSTADWASREYSIQNEFAASLWEYLNVLFLFDANAMLLATRTLRQNGDSLLEVVEFLGEVDAAISTASLRAGSPEWCIPNFVGEGSPTILRDAIHPVVSAPVPNSIVLRPGRGVVLTGANMSGKSTFLRTVGITAVLAQALNTCPARAYSSPRLRVRSAIGRSDDLAAGKSYYLVEVEAVLDFVREGSSSVPHLFLFDELFRGTNTIERLAAGEAVLTALLRDSGHRGRHIVMAATHDIELVEMLAEAYEPYHLEDSIGPEGLSFDYVVRPGPARTRNAIALLEACGAPEELVMRARKTVESLESPGIEIGEPGPHPVDPRRHS